MPVRYRDLQRPTILETGIVDNSSAEYAQQLARTFKAFEQHFTNAAGGMAESIGAQRGAEEGAAGKPDVQRGWRSFTRYGQAYNSAAEVTYANKLQTDIHSTLSQIEADANANPVKYRQLAGDYRDTLMATVPVEFAPRIGQLFDARMAIGGIRLQEQARAKANDEANAGYITSFPTRLNSLIEMLPALSSEAGDEAIKEFFAEDARQREALVTSGAMTAEQSARAQLLVQAKLEEGVANLHISTAVKEVGDLMRQDVTKADAWMAALEDRTDLTDEEKAKIRSAHREDRGVLEYERGKLNFETTANLYKRLARDEFGVGIENEAKRLYKMAAINETEYRSILARSEENAQRVIKERAAATAAEEVMYVGGKLYPGNRDHVKAVNTSFESRAAELGLQPGDPRWVSLASDLAKQSNIVPEGALQWANMALMSGDPVAAASGAEFLAKMRDDNPVAYSWAKEPKTDALADLVHTNIRAGMPRERAYELAMATVNVPEQERIVREAALKDLKKTDPMFHDRALKDAFTEERAWLPDIAPPNMPPALRAEYDRVFEQNYIYTNDVERARDAAIRQVKTNWGVSNVNGKPELTRYPVEKQGFPIEMVRADLEAQAAPFTDKKVVLAPSADTIRTRGRMWAVMTEDEFGDLDVLRNEQGVPAAYVLPSSEAQFEEAKQREIAAAQENLRRERAEAAAIETALSEPVKDALGVPLDPYAK